MKEVKSDIGKLQGQVDKFNQNFDDEFWKQQKKLAEDLKNFSSSLHGKHNNAFSDNE